jgi:hypothetical protein
MAAKWTRIERDRLLDRIFACSVAVILVIIVLRNPFPPTAFGADNSKSDLVPYFVTWHVTGRGYDQRSSANLAGRQVFTASDIWDIAGSAITRFRRRGGLMPVETRYLTVTARRDNDIWDEEWFSNGRNCFSHTSSAVADTGSYSGSNTSIDPHNIPMLFTRTSKQRNGTTISFYEPFTTLVSLKFIGHIVHESSCASGKPIQDMNLNPLGEISPSSPDLFADRDDESSFSIDKRYTATGGPGGKTEVHWVAHAYLMGKCAERDGPIQEGDPVIQNEDVHIDTDDSEITPEGKTKVHIRVTCDGVPVEGAKVEIKVEPVDSSGAHIHVNDRPKGKLDGKDLTSADPSIMRTTDKDGKVKGSDGITFAPPGKEKTSRCLGLAGDYKVIATSEKFKERKDSTMIVVQFKGLTMLPQGQNYDICADSVHGCDKEGPWGTTDHPDSEYGTAGTIKAFQSVATDFWNQEQSHNQLLQACGKKQWPMKQVSFNDIALPWGGLFDMNSTWKQPHKTHGKGQGGDFNHFKGNTCDKGPCLSCGGATVNFDTSLWNMLKYTAQPKYGVWDSEVDTNGDWHLHVEDQGQGPPSSCPADN